MSNFRPQGKAEENWGRTRRALTKEGDAQRATNGHVLWVKFFPQVLVREDLHVDVVIAMCYL